MNQLIITCDGCGQQIVHTVCPDFPCHFFAWTFTDHVAMLLQLHGAAKTDRGYLCRACQASKTSTATEVSNGENV